MIFHDFDPTWPGVEAAIAEVGLSGTVTSGMFLWRAYEPSRVAQSMPTRLSAS